MRFMHFDLAGRIWNYGRRNGLGAVCQRMILGCSRIVAGIGRSCFPVIRDIELPRQPSENEEVERIKSETDLDHADLCQMECEVYFRSLRRNMASRFPRGASLWLFKIDRRVAGWGWTIRGDSMVPYFFPLTKTEVHLFDFFVVPGHRGQGVNVLLVNHILKELAKETQGRALIEAAAWNKAQLRSIAKMPFQKLGSARRVLLLG